MSDEKTWVRTLRCEDVPLRQGRCFHFGERAVAIFNLGDRFVAMDDECPHMSAPLSEGFLMGTTTVMCPLHGWKINLNSGRITTPPNLIACAEVFQTRVEDGVVMVELPGPNQE
jgi:nitrite reductase (NADH) small subunit